MMATVRRKTTPECQAASVSKNDYAKHLSRGVFKRPWITGFVFETIRFLEVKTKIKNLASSN